MNFYWEILKKGNELKKKKKGKKKKEKVKQIFERKFVLSSLNIWEKKMMKKKILKFGAKQIFNGKICANHL